MTALHSEENRRFAEALVEARQAAGLTQRQLGQRLGKDHTFVTKYERLVRRIDVNEFLQIMAALGADPHELIRRLR